MCEVCKSEGENFQFRNGPKKFLYHNVLYKVFKNSVANIKLCHIHSIELFMVGEKKFLKEHIPFARDLARKSTRGTDDDSSASFGF